MKTEEIDVADPTRLRDAVLAARAAELGARVRRPRCRADAGCSLVPLDVDHVVRRHVYACARCDNVHACGPACASCDLACADADQQLDKPVVQSPLRLRFECGVRRAPMAPMTQAQVDRVTTTAFRAAAGTWRAARALPINAHHACASRPPTLASHTLVPMAREVRARVAQAAERCGCRAVPMPDARRLRADARAPSAVETPRIVELDDEERGWSTPGRQHEVADRDPVFGALASDVPLRFMVTCDAGADAERRVAVARQELTRALPGARMAPQGAVDVPLMHGCQMVHVAVRLHRWHADQAHVVDDDAPSFHACVVGACPYADVAGMHGKVAGDWFASADAAPLLFVCAASGAPHACGALCDRRRLTKDGMAVCELSGWCAAEPEACLEEQASMTMADGASQTPSERALQRAGAALFDPTSRWGWYMNSDAAHEGQARTLDAVIEAARTPTEAVPSASLRTAMRGAQDVGASTPSAFLSAAFCVVHAALRGDGGEQRTARARRESSLLAAQERAASQQHMAGRFVCLSDVFMASIAGRRRCAWTLDAVALPSSEIDAGRRTKLAADYARRCVCMWAVAQQLHARLRAMDAGQRSASVRRTTVRGTTVRGTTVQGTTVQGTDAKATRSTKRRRSATTSVVDEADLPFASFEDFVPACMAVLREGVELTMGDGTRATIVERDDLLAALTAGACGVETFDAELREAQLRGTLTTTQRRRKHVLETARERLVTLMMRAVVDGRMLPSEARPEAIPFESLPASAFVSTARTTDTAGGGRRRRVRGRRSTAVTS